MIGLSASTLYFFVMSVYYWNKSRKLNNKMWEHYDTITKYKIMLSNYAQSMVSLDSNNKVLKDQNSRLKAMMAGDFQYEHSAYNINPYVNPHNNQLGK